MDEPAGPTDADLVAQARAGDRDAFGELYTRHEGSIYRFAVHMTGSATLAEDIVQEVFVAFMGSLARFDVQSSLRAYLYGIARHLTLKRLQRERRLVWLDPAVDSAQHAVEARFAERLERRDDLRLLRRAIVALPPRYREVLVLCDLHKLSYDVAAASIGCPVGTVRSRLHRAREALATKVQRLMNAPTELSRSSEGLVI
ncbi:MAG TPA: RNA polymerase sigma factor [Vicinamibacterales bacterium]|nr:RNA polymerase sigma factor [Vicinamibacterales bacterium]